MRRLHSMKPLFVGAVIAIVCAVSISGIQSASAAVQWSTAQHITNANSNWDPMRQADSNQSWDSNGWDEVAAMSCAARGQCTVATKFNANGVGSYGSITSQTNGTWGQNELPANWVDPVLNFGAHNLWTKGVECFANGDCTLVAMEGYTPTFARKTNGVWSAPQIIPGMTCVARFEWPRGCSWGSTFSAPAGTPNLEPNVNDRAGGGVIGALDCSSAGNCMAVGSYMILNTSFDVAYSGSFTVLQTNGVWATPVEIPGVGAMNDVNQGGVGINDVSCANANNCVVVGSVPVFVNGVTNYADPNLWCCRRTYAAVMTNGVMASATLLPGLNTTGESWPSNVQCFWVGNCIVTGFKVASGAGSLFSSSLSNGTWASAVTIPGSTAMAPWNSWWDTQFRSLSSTHMSCPSQGNCTLAGYIRNPSEVNKAFVVDMTNGTWGTMGTIPGVSSLGAGTHTSVSSIDCPAVGECVAIGSFRSSASIGGRYEQPFVAVKTNGTWGNATQIAGINYAQEAIDSGSAWKVSCSGVGECGVAGNLATAANVSRIFVTNYSDPTPPTTTTTTIARATTTTTVARTATTTTTVAPSTTLPAAPIGGVLAPGLGKARIGTRIVEPVTSIAPTGKVELAVGDQTFVVPDSNVDLGRPMTITGSGAKPFTMVTVQLFSTPQVLGSFPVAADGTFSAQVTVPSGTPEGNHSLQMVSLSPTGEEVVVQLGVAVSKAKPLPTTGSHLSPIVPATLMLVLGAMVLTVRRRKATDR